jgi:hypothetical protein
VLRGVRGVTAPASEPNLKSAEEGGDRKKPAARYVSRMLKKAQNRLLARAAQKRLRVFAGTYRAPAARVRWPNDPFSLSCLGRSIWSDRDTGIEIHGRLIAEVAAGSPAR